MKTFVIALVMASLCIVSCTKNETFCENKAANLAEKIANNQITDSTEIVNNLVGRWCFILEQASGFNPDNQTNCIIDSTSFLIFKDDMTLDVEVGDEIIQSAGWTTNGETTTVFFSLVGFGTDLQMSNKHLVISDAALDGPSSYYIKVN